MEHVILYSAYVQAVCICHSLRHSTPRQFSQRHLNFYHPIEYMSVCFMRIFKHTCNTHLVGSPYTILSLFDFGKQLAGSCDLELIA